MTSVGHVAIVGASAAGLAAAEALRNEGFDGRLTLIGEEESLPYDRPPLSKQILAGSWQPEQAQLRKKAVLDGLDAEWRLGRKAVGLDRANRTVLLDDGNDVAFEVLVIATGVAPRSLGPRMDGVHVLRTLKDAIGLRQSMLKHRRIVIIGAGFLGSECAAVARTNGLEVVLAYPQEFPLVRAFGREVGRTIADLHEARGVELRPHSTAHSLLARSGAVQGVRFSDGSICHADLVLLATGSVPATGWLAGSGLDLGDGVRCDACCQAAPGIFAAGDVASWYHQSLGMQLRLEHRMNATEQGMMVARNVLGARQPFCPIPFVWSDQHDERIQAYGVFPPASNIRVETLAGDRRRFVASYFLEGRLVGALGWNAARELRTLRAELALSVAIPRA